MMKNRELKFKNKYFPLPNHKEPRGFTLIELLVVMTVFTIIGGTITGLFMIGLRQQKAVLNSQIILDQISYDLEYMGRALRFAIKDSTGGCIPAGTNYQITSRDGLRFINHLQTNDCQEFFLEDEQIKYWRESPESGNTLPLTSSNTKVTSLRFELEGEEEGDNLQPKVTILLEIKAGTDEEAQIMKIQT